MVGIIRESENVSEEEVGTEACLCIATMELVCSLVDSADKKNVSVKRKKKELMYVTTLLHRADTYTFRSNNRHIKIPRVAGEISSCIDAYQRITQQTLRLPLLKRNGKERAIRRTGKKVVHVNVTS